MRRLSRDVADPRTAANLKLMAAEFDAKAVGLETASPYVSI